MNNKIRKSLAAISLIGLSSAAFSGVVFHTLPGETSTGLAGILSSPEVANDGTVLYFQSNDSKWKTWNADPGFSPAVLNITTSHVHFNHQSNDGKYMAGKDSTAGSSTYNYYTPTGVIQRGQTGFAGRVIHKMSGNGKRLFGLNSVNTAPGSYLYFFENGGRNEQSRPTANDYIAALPFGSGISLASSVASDETGDRILLKHSATTYFVDITGSTNTRNANLTALPINFFSIVAISDDGESVLGTVSNLSPGCSKSNVVYHQTNGLTEINCSDEFNLVGFSGDGAKVVGYDDTTSYIWDETSGVRDLKNILSQNGVNTGNWPTLRASDISEDGLKITGWAINTSGKGKAFLMEVVPECNVGF